MSMTTKPAKSNKKNMNENQGVPSGLEWLASIAEKDMQRRREEIIQEAVAAHKRERANLPK